MYYLHIYYTHLYTNIGKDMCMSFKTFKIIKQIKGFHCVYNIYSQIHWEKIGIGGCGKNWLNLEYPVHKTDKTFNERELYVERKDNSYLLNNLRVYSHGSTVYL